MGANDHQIGGDHYGGRGYQHWDWVVDVRLPYLIGNATKYIARWRKKNRDEDLRKAGHYLDKALEWGKTPSLNKLEVAGIKVMTKLFEEDQSLMDWEGEALLACALGDYAQARHLVETALRSSVMEELESGSPGA